jgi:hypothetical protein
MSVWRPTRTARLGLAVVCCLGLLAPAGAAVRAAGPGSAAAAAVLGGSPDGLGQALLRDRVLGPLVAPGAKRDDRERPGPALPGVVAAALATVAALASRRRRTDRPPRRAAAAAPGARAPPSLQPAPI